MNFKQKKDMKRIITKMYLCLLAFCIAGGISAQTQNSMTEVIPFKTIDGKIIVEAAIIPKEPTKKFPMDIKKRLKKRKASSYLKPCL